MFLEKDKGKKKDKKEGKSIFGSSTGNSRDRHYICKSRQERDQVRLHYVVLLGEDFRFMGLFMVQVMEEIFRICFYGDTLKWPLEYQVIKVEGGLKANLAIGAVRLWWSVVLATCRLVDLICFPRLDDADIQGDTRLTSHLG